MQIEGLPNAGVREGGAGKGVVEVLGAIDIIAEDMEKCEVVHELGIVVGVETVQLRGNLVADIAGDGVVTPHFTEPVVVVGGIALGIDDEVQFDVISRRF